MNSRWIQMTLMILSTAVSQTIYPVNQLHEENFINCNSGEYLHGFPLNITIDGACSLRDFQVPSDGFYRYTLVFVNMTTNMYVYIDGVQYFYNLSQQVNSSLLVQIIHQRNSNIQQLSSIDIIPTQGYVLLQRIIIEQANNDSQQISYNYTPAIFNADDFQIKISNIQVQNATLLIALQYNQSLLQYTQPQALDNDKNMALDIVNDSLICQGNLTSLDLVNQALFSDVYNVTFQFETQQIRFQSTATSQMQVLHKQFYLIQVINDSFGLTDYEILDSQHPTIRTNTELILDDSSDLTYIIQVQDMQNKCNWFLKSPNVSLQAEDKIYYITTTQYKPSCQWWLTLPSNIERQKYNLTFDTQISGTKFEISQTFQINLEPEPNSDTIQYAIIVYIICMISAFLFMIPCLIFVNRLKLGENLIFRKQYSLFIYSCFNEALNPTSEQDLAQLKTTFSQTFAQSGSESAGRLSRSEPQQNSQIEIEQIDQPIVGGTVSNGFSENTSQVHQQLIENEIPDELPAQKIQHQSDQEQEDENCSLQKQEKILEASFSIPINQSPRSKNQPSQFFSSSNHVNLSQSGVAQQDQSPLQTPINDRNGLLE